MVSNVFTEYTEFWCAMIFSPTKIFKSFVFYCFGGVTIIYPDFFTDKEYENHQRRDKVSVSNENLKVNSMKIILFVPPLNYPKIDFSENWRNTVSIIPPLSYFILSRVIFIYTFYWNFFVRAMCFKVTYGTVDLLLSEKSIRKKQFHFIGINFSQFCKSSSITKINRRKNLPQ